MSSPRYQKVETNSSDSQEELADSLAVTMAHVSNIPSTHSSQQLMSPDAESVLTEEDAKSLSRRNRQAAAESTGFHSVTSKEWFTVGVLCFINLINYMDRFTIAGEFRGLIHSRSHLLLFGIPVVCINCSNTTKADSLRIRDEKTGWQSGKVQVGKIVKAKTKTEFYCAMRIMER